MRRSASAVSRRTALEHAFCCSEGCSGPPRGLSPRRDPIRELVSAHRMTVLEKAARAAVSWLEYPRRIGPPPAPTPAPRPLPNPLRGSGAGVMSVRPDVAAIRSAVPPAAHADMPDRRITILPPGQRERRRGRADRRRADRRTQDLGAPYGADRRSGHDDRQADRRARTPCAAGIGLMRDYFSPGPGAPGGVASPPAPPHVVVCNHD